jgi:hypothetical protein
MRSMVGVSLAGTMGLELARNLLSARRSNIWYNLRDRCIPSRIGAATTMEAADILARAKSGEETPQGWVVFPISRAKVATGIVGWFLGIIIGFGLFAFVASDVIPYNYERGVLAALFTTLFLGIFLFIGLGSIWCLIVDARRLRTANNHIIVITPDEFVKQEGSKIVHVPLMYVRYVTVRGRSRSSDRTPSKENVMNEIPSAGDNVSGFLFGRGIVPSGFRTWRKRMRTPTSLAFLDTRDDSEVIVLTDDAYGDPYLIAAFIKQYSRSVQQAV